MNALLNNDAQFSGEVLDHLGLVAATIDQLGLIDKIDQRLPLAKEKGAKVSMGERVTAMILNGLGFIDDRLYLFPEFLRNKPVDALFNKPLKAEYFNDDAIGRCLDAIADYGETQLFTECALAIGIEQNLLGKTAHFDTSTLSVYGDYDEDENEKMDSSNADPFKLNYGYSKAHRPDLKQAVINLATTGKSGFPVWMEAHSGNASDAAILKKATERMQAFCKSLKAAPNFTYVADSASYSGFVSHGHSMPWLTRVPERIKTAKELASMSDEEFFWKPVDENYKICRLDTQSGGVNQRWLVVYSSQAEKREIKTLHRRIEKEKIAAEKSFKKLARDDFQCESDALRAGEQLAKTLSYHRAELSVEKMENHSTKGRPRKGQQPDLIHYKIGYQLVEDDNKIKPHQNRKGRFILASNLLDEKKLSDEAMLFEYKNQSKTERGFKFIKDDTFEVDSIFLKKPSRISALMMVMTLCLMVYGVAQHHLRETLSERGETLPNQKNIETTRVSMKWIFRLFHGVQRLTITLPEGSRQLIINLNNILNRVVSYFGPRACAIYHIAME